MNTTKRTSQVTAAQRGWVPVPADRTAASDAAERLAADLGIGPDKAQEIIDAAYR